MQTTETARQLRCGLCKIDVPREQWDAHVRSEGHRRRLKLINPDGTCPHCGSRYLTWMPEWQLWYCRFPTCGQVCRDG